MPTPDEDEAPPERPQVDGFVVAILDPGTEEGEALGRFKALMAKTGEETWPYLVAFTPEEIVNLQRQAQMVAINAGITVRLVAFTRGEVLEEFTPVIKPVDHTLIDPRGRPLRGNGAKHPPIS